VSNGNGLKTGIAAVVGTAMLVVTPTTSSASSPEGWDICPAIDTQPICEIVHPRNQPGSDGTAVTNRPTTGDATIWTGDTKDHPDDEHATGTAELVDVPEGIRDYNCDEWRNPVIACPGLDGTAAVIDIPDYDCTEWRNPVIACPG
jgi:hypothetical protein